MTKSELVEVLSARHPDLPGDDARLVVSVVLDAMSESIASGRRIEIRGFGSFELHRRHARTNRNPKTGEAVAVPAKRVPRFKVGKLLKERVTGAVKP